MKLKQIREVDIAIFRGWHFVYVDGTKFKRSRNFRKLERMINSLKSVCRKVKSNRSKEDFTTTIEKQGGADYLFNFKAYDKGYAFFLIGLEDGCVSPLYSDFDKLFEDLKEILEIEEMDVEELLERIKPKREPCYFCGSMETSRIKGMWVCTECRKKYLKSLVPFDEIFK